MFCNALINKEKQMKYNKLVAAGFSLRNRINNNLRNLIRRLKPASLLRFSGATTLLIIPILAFADASQNLTTILNSTHTMQANFTQLTGTQSNSIRTTGKMSLERPGKFRWEIISPNKQLIVANGKTLWIYDPDLLQVNKQRIDSQTNNPAMLLSGTIDLAKTFRIQQLAATGNKIFVLMPRNTQSSIFQKVQLTFNGDELQKMEIIDNLGQKSVISFSEIALNSVLNQGLFAFKIPPNVDVIQ
jgi:outer membrane lipoprotein carrier protein